MVKWGLFQYAAGRGKVEQVKIFVDAGVDVNQVPPGSGDIREPGPGRALWMAVDAQRSDYGNEHLEVARFLLEKGADMNLPARPAERTQTALEAAQAKTDPRMLRLFEEFIGMAGLE